MISTTIFPLSQEWKQFLFIYLFIHSFITWVTKPNDYCFTLCCMLQTTLKGTLHLMTPLYVSRQCVGSPLHLTDASLASKEGFPTMWLSPQLLIGLDQYVIHGSLLALLFFLARRGEEDYKKRLKGSQHHAKAPPAGKVFPPDLAFSSGKTVPIPLVKVSNFIFLRDMYSAIIWIPIQCNCLT